MRRLLFAAALLPYLGYALPAWADDASDAQAVISAQLGALRASDAAGAYGFAAPNIQRIFPSADIFMTMVQRGYPAVADARNVAFGPSKPEGVGLRQEVFLSDPQGQSWIATYTLERQPDGSMKITGCQMRKGTDIGA